MQKDSIGAATTDLDAIVLKQRKIFGREQVLTIANDEIGFRRKSLFTLNTYSIPLKELESEPQRYRAVPAGWFIAMIVFLLLNIAWTTFILTSSQKGSVKEGVFFCFVIGIFNIVTTHKVYEKWADFWVFAGKGGSLAIWPSHPNKKEVNDFVRTLSEKIEASHTATTNREQDFLDILRREGIVDEWGYNKAIELLKRLNN